MDTAEGKRYADKTVIVTGAATGIGGALTAELVGQGARVHTLDIAPVAAEVTMAVQCDLGDQGSIDTALELLPPNVDALFNCAGVPNGGRFSAAEVMAINWFGLRHLTESVLERMAPDTAVVHVASTAGRGWPAHEAELRSLMEADGFDAGAAWVEAHAELVGDGYSFSKEAVQWYTMWRSLPVLAARGVRMNSICPGVTDTQLAQDFRKGVGDDVINRAIAVAGRLAEPREMVGAMLFLADHGQASYVNGINLNVDRGTGAAHATGAF
jgi:NAD(P)-dependent dehydrogenase (short-subunit alcohol dehydrogenase family)